MILTYLINIIEYNYLVIKSIIKIQLKKLECRGEFKCKVFTYPSYINVIPSTGVHFSGNTEFTYILQVCLTNEATLSMRQAKEKL